jgi:hypothetical protein
MKMRRSEMKLISFILKALSLPFKPGKDDLIIELRAEMERQLKHSWILGKSAPCHWTEHPRSTMDGPYHLWTFLKRNKISDNEEAGL